MNFQDIRNLIGQGDTKGAIKALISLVQEGAGRSKRLHDDLLILSNRFEELKRNVEQQAAVLTDIRLAAAQATVEERVQYRRCPHCREFMNRVNFGRYSGVIVDVCREHGTLMAHWLFCTTNTTGALNTAAKLSAAWKSPWLVAPSPLKPRATMSSPRRTAAMAAPTACGSCGPITDDQLTTFAARPAMWLGIWRPLFTSPALP